MESTNNLRIGVIGAGGNIARIAWIGNLQRPGVALHGYDAFPEARRRAEQLGCTVHPTLAALLEQDLHGVVVATPPQFHYDGAMAVLRAAERGGSLEKLIVEKPLTLDFGQAVELVGTAEHLGVEVSQPFHQLIALRALIAAVRDGLIGDLSAVGYSWLRRDPGPNGLEDLGPHAFAMLLALGAGIDWVAVTADSAGELELRLQGDVPAAVRIGSVAAVQEEVRLDLFGADGASRAYLRTTLTPPSELAEYRPAVYLGRTRDPELPETDPVFPFGAVQAVDRTRAAQARMWLDSFAGGMSLPAHGRMTLEVQAVLAAATASAAAGGTPTAVPRLL